MVWNRTTSAVDAATLASFAAAASAASPLYIEWARETTPNDREVVAGVRRIRPDTIVRMELITAASRESFVRAARRDRRDGRKDFRFFTGCVLKAYSKPQEHGNTCYVQGWALPQMPPLA